MPGRQLRNRLVPSPSSSSNSSSSDIVPGRQLRSRVVPVPSTPSSASCPNKSGPHSSRPSTEPESCVCRTLKSRVQRRTAAMSPRSARMSLGVSPRSSLLRAPTRKQRSNESAAPKVHKKQDVSKSLRKQDDQKNQPSQVVFNCSGKLFSCDGNNHQCPLCISRCPLASDRACEWEGSINSVVAHIGKSHCSVGETTGPNLQIKLQNWRISQNPTQWVTFQTCLGQHFLIAVEKMEVNNCSLFMGTVRVFGHQDIADRFESRMTLKSSGRTFSYSTTVKPIHDKTATEKRDCFVFDSALAEVFSLEENLDIAVSISVTKM